MYKLDYIHPVHSNRVFKRANNYITSNFKAESILFVHFGHASGILYA
jgi:hypothetical protein